MPPPPPASIFDAEPQPLPSPPIPPPTSGKRVGADWFEFAEGAAPRPARRLDDSIFDDGADAPAPAIGAMAGNTLLAPSPTPPPAAAEGWFADVDSIEHQQIPGTGPSVLVVDDEPQFRNFLKDALSAQGYQVHTAINGPNALRFVKTQAGIDLVICDLHMPHMDGFELKHEIDKLIGRAMPFIVCTADTSEDKIQTAAQVGAAALVPKPIDDLDAFYAIVTDTLKDAGVISRSATS